MKNNQKVCINYSHLQKDYIFAGDIAKAIALLIDSNINGIVNLCSGKSISLEEIALTIAKKFDKIDLLELKQLNTNEPKIIVGDNSILLDKLNFRNYLSIDKWIDSI